MTDYLTANARTSMRSSAWRPRHGDDPTGVRRRGRRRGLDPGRRLGGTGETAQAVKDGYVNAAFWGYPDASGYDSIVLLNKAATGLSIGYDVPTQTLYDATTADTYIALTSPVRPADRPGSTPAPIDTDHVTRPRPPRPGRVACTPTALR